MAPFLYILISYLVGSIPFGFLAGKVAGKDLREHGSRNIGATNAMRVLGRKWGISVFILDFLKGFLPAWLWFGYISPNFIDPAADHAEWLRYGSLVLVGLATIIGHTYTCFLHFKGGKGVATTAGVLAALSPVIVVISVLGWLLALVVTRYVSVASIIAALTMVLAALFHYGYFGDPGWSFRPDSLVILLLVLVAALVIVKHRGNIQRLLQGVEPKAFTKKS